MVTVVNQSLTGLGYFSIGAVTMLYMLHSIVNIRMEGECVTDEQFWYFFKVKYHLFTVDKV